jgi:predicted MFS family arabinose efflux permease
VNVRPSRRSRSHSVELGVLTGTKAVSNTAQRWVGPFLPTLERAFDASTGTLTGVMGVCELGGLTTVASGPWLDRGRERTIFVLGTAAVALSSAIALGGSVITFAISYALLVVGIGNLTSAGHAWIGHRVPFTARGRAIGVFEMSWAVALLVGAPLLALLIHRFGWRGPYVALAVAGGVAAGIVVWFVTPGEPTTPTRTTRVPLPRSAWLPILASASTSAAGLGTFVVSGAWLNDAYGVSTGGLGVIAAAFGGIELASSSGVALLGDRIGTRRSVRIGLLVLGAGVGVILMAGDSRFVAVAGLLTLLAGFEYAFVSSLTMVTEAAPASRGRAIGISNAFGTLARAAAVGASGQLYEAFGISGSLALACGTAGLAFAAVTASRQPT